MNKEIIEKLKDKDLLKIMASASSRYIYTLSKEEINTGKLNAMWKASKRYNQDSGCKFTTYLYKGVEMECRTQQKFNSKNDPHNKQVHTNMPDPTDYVKKMEILDLINNCDDPDLIYDRFYKNMTITELAQERGVCGETIRIKIKKTLKRLKSNFI